VIPVRRWLAGAALLGITACSDSVTGPSLRTGHEFELHPGDVAVLVSASVAVRFDRVTGDSRCPADVYCIQGGDAIVEITVLSSAGESPYELHTGSMDPVQHGDLTISLVQLLPYPFSSTPIPPEGYRATLRVAR
jgi:hypothetical protein